MSEEPLSAASQDRRLVEFFAGHLERDGAAAGRSTLTFGILGTGDWQTVTRWPTAGTGTQRWHLGTLGSLTREAGPADPAGLGVPRTFARRGARPVSPGTPMDLAVQLLPVAAAIRAGHRIRVAIAGHDASCFARYGPAEETFTLSLGGDSRLDLPVRYG